MKAVIQRVTSAFVTVEGKKISSIDKGLLILLGIQVGDTDKDLHYLSKKISDLRIFENKGNFDLSIYDIGGKALVVSQFTLLGRTKKGNRPDFLLAEKPDKARELYNKFCDELNKTIDVERGVFGAKMKITLVNDGPVTIIIDTRENL